MARVVRAFETTLEVTAEAFPVATPPEPMPVPGCPGGSVDQTLFRTVPLVLSPTRAAVKPVPETPPAS